VLLDTHVWIWAAAGDKRRVGPRTKREIERARTRGELHVSAVSIFEIAALYVAGRLDLSSSPEDWVRESLDLAGLKVLDVTGRIAIEAGAIPAGTLSDPCDRLLVASARHRGVALVTRDARLLTYARETRRVRVIDAAR
jgi:PIN domain nuclease of toxin-antitoxin system